MDEDNVNVLAAQVKALNDLVDNRINGLVEDIGEIKLALAKLSNGVSDLSISSHDLQRMIIKVDNHDDRLARLERVYWMQVGLYGLIAPIIVWFLIRLLSGALP